MATLRFAFASDAAAAAHASGQQQQQDIDPADEWPIAPAQAHPALAASPESALAAPQPTLHPDPAAADPAAALALAPTSAPAPAPASLLALPDWACEEVDKFAERALRRSAGASPMHVMEIVSRSKKQYLVQGLASAKQWSSPILRALMEDPRIIFQDERFYAAPGYALQPQQMQPIRHPLAESNRGIEFTTAEEAVAAADGPEWAADAIAHTLQLIYSKPAGAGLSKAELKALSTRRWAAHLVPAKEWRKVLRKMLVAHPGVEARGKGAQKAYHAIRAKNGGGTEGPVSTFAEPASVGVPNAWQPSGAGAARDFLLHARAYSARTPMHTASAYRPSHTLQPPPMRASLDASMLAELPTYDERVQFDAAQEDDGSVGDGASELSQEAATDAPAPALSADSDTMFADMFLRNVDAVVGGLQHGCSLLAGAASEACPERGLLGSLLPPCFVGAVASSVPPPWPVTSVHLNTHEPFCLVTIGVQGGGKSHTLGVVLEDCLLPCEAPGKEPMVRLNKPLTALVLHYDLNQSSICEATGLATPSPVLASFERNWSLPRDRIVVLVSPSNYKQRQAFYGDRFTVRPLLFAWRFLTADHLKRLMRIKDTDNQLYVASMLELLRRYQRHGGVPEFGAFMTELLQLCKLPGQGAALSQRIGLLNSIIRESRENNDIREQSAGLVDSLRPGQLVIVDLTDPLLARDEVNGIFQVLVEQFRALPLKQAPGGRLLALDEAHRYMDGTAADGLSDAIVDAARLMRHDGLRLAISTQSPKALAPELLELVSVAVLHRFHSRDWMEYLRAKLPLEPHHFQQLMDLSPGEAVVFAGRHRVAPLEGASVFGMRIRKRLTADRGVSRTNAQVQGHGSAPQEGLGAQLHSQERGNTAPELASESSSSSSAGAAPTLTTSAPATKSASVALAASNNQAASMLHLPAPEPSMSATAPSAGPVADCEVTFHIRPGPVSRPWRLIPCERYHSSTPGECSFGERCDFLHDEVRVRGGPALAPDTWLLISPRARVVWLEQLSTLIPQQRTASTQRLEQAEQARFNQLGTMMHAEFLVEVLQRVASGPIRVSEPPLTVSAPAVAASAPASGAAPATSTPSTAALLGAPSDSELLSLVRRAVQSGGSNSLGFPALGLAIKQRSGQLWKKLVAHRPDCATLQAFIEQHPEAFELRAGGAAAPAGIVVLRGAQSGAADPGAQRWESAAGGREVPVAAPAPLMHSVEAPGPPARVRLSSITRSDEALVNLICAAIRRTGQPSLGISLLGNALHDHSGRHWASCAAPRTESLKEFLLRHPEVFEIRPAKDPLVVVR